METIGSSETQEVKMDFKPPMAQLKAASGGASKLGILALGLRAWTIGLGFGFRGLGFWGLRVWGLGVLGFKGLGFRGLGFATHQDPRQNSP